MNERQVLADGLRDLADTPPPRQVWERIDAQARAEGLIRRPGQPPVLRWLAGSGIAAAVVLVVLNLPMQGNGPVDVTAANGNGQLPTVPVYDPNSEAVQFDSINALMVQSRLLEENLRRLPSQPSLARAGTLATIDDLQGRVAAIDYRLNDPQADLSPEQRRLFWQERVRLMDSLVRLRYAQAQRVSF